MAQDKKLKIGYFMDEYFPAINGVNYVMDNCARSFGDRCEVVVVVPRMDRTYVDNFPYRVIRVKALKPKLFEHKWALPMLDTASQKKLRDEHFDLIHFHSPFIMGRYAVHFARKNNIPVVGTIHTQYGLELDRMHLKGFCKNAPMEWLIKTFNLCDECFAHNTSILEMFRELGVTNKISLISNATEMTVSETPAQDRAETELKYHLTPKDAVLLFVGRISTVKNILFLLDSLGIVRDRGTDFRMLFVGPLEDGKILEKKIKELRLEDRITVCGPIYDRDLLKKIYVRADLFLFPSYYDTSSLVQVEAASQYTPTLFLENTPTATGIEDGKNGFLSPFDKTAYAEKIIQILNDRALLCEVSRNCHDSLYKTWDRVCDTLYQKYSDLLGSR